MNKLKYIPILALTSSIFFSACNSKKEKAPQSVAQKAVVDSANQSSGLIAYVEIDSIGSRYQYCIDEREKLEKQQKEHQRTLSREQRSLQQAVVAFQKDVQEGKIYSQEAGEKRQAQLQKQEQRLMQHQEELRGQLLEMQMAFEQGWRERLTNFIRRYNKDGKYDVIFSNNATTLNILFAKPSFDITEEVIIGLNKEYKKK